MSAQGILNSVFSCSSPAAKALSKRRLRQTRSLDPAIIRNYSAEDLDISKTPGHLSAGFGLPSPECLDASKFEQRSNTPALTYSSPSYSSPSTPHDTSPSTNFHFDFDFKGAKRNTAWDLPFLARSPSITPASSTSTIFSPRRWLQRKSQPQTSQAYVVWKSEGDFTWNSLSGRSVRLKPVAVQSLSELERVRLQEVAYARLHQDYDLGCQITIPKDGQKRKKSLRRKLDSLAKEKNRDKECVPQAFAIPLSQVITNDRAQRQRQDGLRQDAAPREDQRDTSDLVSSILQFATKRPATKELSSSNSSLSSTSETANESSPNTPEAAPRARRRGGMSVDSITDLDDNQSRLLEALQLSLPADTPSKKEKHRDKRLSLNPIYRQVPRVVDCCCQHMEKYGLQTVGIFRVGSSKKRVRQLREEFDRGVEVQLEEEHSVHDVAALLKEFLRDMPDPLLTKELYTAFISTMLLDPEDQQICTQLLVYLLPACNSDTLHRLLDFLSTVARHAHDSQDKDGQEVTGNKMTSLNLATIFGPNLLHKQKNSDKEFSVQSSARAEESTAVIAVVQRMIDTFDALFMVPPDLQNEVLMSLLETDPDVVDYLLRRKASHRSPDLLRSEASFTISERRSSSDSNKASSGELSPYDNNSPVLCERRGTEGAGSSVGGGGSSGPERLFRVPEQYALVGQVAGKSRESSSSSSLWSPTKDVSEEHVNIWGAWHSTLKPGLKDQAYTGSHGNVSEGSSRSSQEGIDGHHGDGRHQPRQRAQTHTAVSPQPHLLASRSCSSPHSASSSSEDLPLGSSHANQHHHHVAFAKQGSRKDSRPPPPVYCGHSATGSATLPPISRAHQQGSGRSAVQNSTAPTGTVPSSSDWQDWQRDRWHIWQLLSSDNADTLPETLV
ncbi:rho GTPase-activating protein 6-like isoform X1 [Alosa sapidissima]|uniref:rho GTPase-activating protein 6-like isoform X1 n=1 Tax=Alosa sapidissima TaxID=34773 RepID=UPI001C09D899|nr:rho GTPase-activating protein 6-like isoform X1 [Alosa sapidissima]